jgi:hypothetical protein
VDLVDIGPCGPFIECKIEKVLNKIKKYCIIVIVRIFAGICMSRLELNFCGSIEFALVSIKR